MITKKDTKTPFLTFVGIQYLMHIDIRRFLNNIYHLGIYLCHYFRQIIKIDFFASCSLTSTFGGVGKWEDYHLPTEVLYFCHTVKICF